jgi:hypothetical protein
MASVELARYPDPHHGDKLDLRQEYREIDNERILVYVHNTGHGKARQAAWRSVS